MDESVETISFSRQMTITLAEFFRIFPAAIQGRNFKLDDRKVSIAEGNREIIVKLSEEKQRKLAALLLPVLDVEFTFSGYSKVEVKDFMKHFDLHFQRAGG